MRVGAIATSKQVIIQTNGRQAAIITTCKDTWLNEMIQSSPIHSLSLSPLISPSCLLLLCGRGLWKMAGNLKATWQHKPKREATRKLRAEAANLYGEGKT